MLNKDQILTMAQEWLRSANGNLRDRKWLPAVQGAGHAVELMLKLRTCVDHNLAGFPEDLAEAKPLGQKQYITHDLETLLSFTGAFANVKKYHPAEWGACLQWNPNTKYQPMGSHNKKSATELLRAASVIFECLKDHSDMSAIASQAAINPYLKLWDVEKKLAADKGPFRLFAICHRVNSYEHTADVVVCASWIDPYTRDGVQDIEDGIVTALGEEERINRISGVIALSESNAIVKGFTRGPVKLINASGTFRNVSLNDWLVEFATVITADYQES